jgi:hypothetical protein
MRKQREGKGWGKADNERHTYNRFRQPYLGHCGGEELRKTGLECLPPSLRRYGKQGECPIGCRACEEETSQRCKRSEKKERRCDDGEDGSGGWQREGRME